MVIGVSILWIFHTPTGELIFHVMASLAQFESSLISQRVIALSKIILECKDDSIEKDKYICFLQREVKKIDQVIYAITNDIYRTCLE